MRRSPELPNDVERERVPRPLSVFLIRHGEALGKESDVPLTDKGREQARAAARELLQIIEQEGGGLVKIVSSPYRRTRETAEEIESVFGESIAKSQEARIKMYAARGRPDLRPRPITSRLRQQGVAAGDIVEYWLSHPQAVPGASPAEAANDLREVLVSLRGVADRVGPGEHLYYLAVNHDIPQSALLSELVDIKPIGENAIKNGEFIRLDVAAGESLQVEVSFRGQSAVVPLRQVSHEEPPIDEVDSH